MEKYLPAQAVLAERCKALRDAHGLSQTEVAKRASSFRRPKSAGKTHAPINQRTIGRLESNEGNPTLEIIEAVASVFSLSPWQLISPEGGSGAASMSKDEQMLIDAFPHLESGVREIWLSSARATLETLDRQKKVA
jgi:transcriptional regulator with XRE-family HTH domain